MPPIFFSPLVAGVLRQPWLPDGFPGTEPLVDRHLHLPQLLYDLFRHEYSQGISCPPFFRSRS
jgi:hypothetical protein